MEVDVGAGKDVRQAFAANIVLGDIFFHPRQRQRAGRLRHRTHIFKQIFHRRADSVAIHGDNIIKVFLTQPERFVADAFYRHAFSKQPNAREIHWMTDFQRRFQAGGILRFDGNNVDLRHQLV
nr:Uncharacterised protein [Salmonella sp. NCTC 7297]